MSKLFIFLFVSLFFCGSALARTVHSFNDHWEVNTLEHKDSQFHRVTLPHTFNAHDADDGGEYYRGVAIYRKKFSSPCKNNELTYLEFGSATLRAELFLNGQALGSHEGGYTRFRFKLPKHQLKDKNELQVRVDNSWQQHISPLGGDFSIFGGITRGVNLICTKPLHFDLDDYGSDGIYIQPELEGKQSATLRIRSRVTNDQQNSLKATLGVEILNMEGAVVAAQNKPLQLAPLATSEVSLVLKIDKARLWNGTLNPALYRAKFSLITDQSAPEDSVDIEFGIRSVKIDSELGLLLNGKKYNAHGVNLHLSQRPGKGPAVTLEEEKEDFQILDELGLKAIRLSHYPHPNAIYKHANRKGYLLWSEIPLVADVGDSPKFLKNIVLQLREMIRQNYNHPSIFVWGLGNEIYSSDEKVHRVLKVLQKVAKKEDPHRYTVYANCCGPVTQRIATHTDLNASNIYHGWYPQQSGEMSQWLDTAKKSLKDRALAVSEYGAGASILHQQDPPLRPKTDGDWHPEQYQNLVHEKNWAAIQSKPWVWASFIWVAFDFASDGRNEGDRAGINDKGLVTYDRAERKDAYYWYQANWSEKPMVYITSRRMVNRETARVQLKVYSNQENLKLFINDNFVSTRKVDQRKAIWQIEMKNGANKIEVRSENASVGDSVVWYLKS